MSLELQLHELYELRATALRDRNTAQWLHWNQRVEERVALICAQAATDAVAPSTDERI